MDHVPPPPDWFYVDLHPGVGIGRLDLFEIDRGPRVSACIDDRPTVRMTLAPGQFTARVKSRRLRDRYVSRAAPCAEDDVTVPVVLRMCAGLLEGEAESWRRALHGTGIELPPSEAAPR